jgi:hypothetical protein
MVSPARTAPQLIWSKSDQALDQEVALPLLPFRET